MGVSDCRGVWIKGKPQRWQSPVPSPGVWNCVFDHESGGRGAREVPRGRRAGPLALTRWGHFVGYSLHSYT